MPANRVEWVNQPFVGPSRVDTSGYGRTLADLLYQRGNQTAAIHLQRGDAAARTWGQAGASIAGAVDSWRQSVAQKRQQEIENARELRTAEAQGIQMDAAKLQLGRAQRQEQGEQVARDLLPLAQRQDGVVGYDRAFIQKELESAGHADMVPQVFQQLDAQEEAHLKVKALRRDAVAGDAFRLLQSGGDERSFNSMIALWEANDAVPQAEIEGLRNMGKTPEGRQRALLAAVNSSPTFAEQVRKMQAAEAPQLKAFKPGDVVVDERNPGAGPLFAVPPEDKAPANIEAAILEAQRRGDTATVNQLLGMKKDIAAAGRAPAAPGAPEPLVAITGPDGKPVFVPRSQAIGKAPANTREQGRQVTSGDAGDIAELNTALDDLATLKTELTGNGATGTSAQIGASLWAPITNLTGWGTEAKQKQAQIDRVKQVIGKALEGGVLRKEDEIKYEKILPTIKDSPEIVRSKLNGLVTAIERKHGRKLEALSSAGYDVSRFSGAGAAPDADGWQTIDGIRVRVKP